MPRAGATSSASAVLRPLARRSTAGPVAPLVEQAALQFAACLRRNRLRPASRRAVAPRVRRAGRGRSRGWRRAVGPRSGTSPAAPRSGGPQMMARTTTSSSTGENKAGKRSHGAFSLLPVRL